MRITKVSIDGFGMFDGPFEIEFPGEIALIVGDNETGKSTILSAIGAILFGLRNENEKAVFAPHGAASPRSGSLEIEAGGKRHRLGRNFATNHARVELLGESESVLFDGSAKPRGRTDEKDTYDELMRKLLGTESRDVFQNSVMAEQNSLEPEMKNIVRQIVSGSSSADYAIVLENLKEFCDDLSMELPWRRGTARKLRRIELLQNEITEKKRALTEAREASSIIEESSSRLSSVESKLADVENNIADKEAWTEALGSFSQALMDKKRTEKELSEHRNEMREVEKLSDELKRCTEKIEAEYSKYASLPEQAEADMASLSQLTETEESLEERYQQSEADVPRFGPSRFSVAAIVVGLFVAGIGAIFFHGLLKVGAVVAGAGACGLSLVSTYLSLRTEQSARRAKLDEIEEQIRNLRAQSMDLKRRYPALNGRDTNEILKRLRELKPLRREKEIKEAALRQHPALDEIEGKYNQLSNGLVIANNKLEQLKSQRPGLADVERSDGMGKAIEEAESDLPRLERQRRELADERGSVKLMLARAEASETISEEVLEEDIAEAESELARLKHGRDAHLLAVKTLGEAISEFRRAHLVRIEKKASDYLDRVIGEQCLMRLNEDLEPLEVKRAGRLLKPEQLSQGFRDQMHFALRLAAAEEISGDVRLPILLDDPFVNFDEKRLEATLRMLEKLSESHQVVLFTHDRRYINWREPARLL